MDGPARRTGRCLRDRKLVLRIDPGYGRNPVGYEPDRHMAEHLREAIESDGDKLADLHLWRLGPGHLGAILSVITAKARGPDFYRAQLARFHALSHVTIEIERPAL
jgi:Co/Zn/Cd efflux system component